jgi:hypothetical protein
MNMGLKERRQTEMNSSDLEQGPLVGCREHGHEHSCFLRQRICVAVTVSLTIYTLLLGIWRVSP